MARPHAMTDRPTPAHPDRNAPTEAAREALGWLHTARFLTTAAQLNQLPALEVPEIAFVGRSNAGKSTAINTLTQQNQLAFASRRPGRTQHINLFALGRQGTTDAVLTDLPYGESAKILEESGRDVPLAILMALTGAKREECEKILKKNRGNIRLSLKELGGVS